MSAQTARSLFESLPTPRKKLVFFAEAQHGDAWEADPDRYLSTITSFLQELGETAVKASSGASGTNE